MLYSSDLIVHEGFLKILPISEGVIFPQEFLGIIEQTGDLEFVGLG